MVILELFIFIFLGLICGSFASAIAHREERGMKWWSLGGGQERSACSSCQNALQAQDLIPIFSWLRHKGHCRQCGAKMSPAYLALELGCALAALAVYLVHGLSIESVFLILALPFLAALTVVDIRQMILPNRLVLILGVLGLVRLIVEGFVFQIIDPVFVGANHVLAAFLYGGFAFMLGKIFTVILKKDALGFGDVKFFAVAGLWLGLMRLPEFCILAGVLGVVFALVWRATTNERVFPFGPSLIASFYGLLLLESSLFL
ncbi:MAG: prepilin peptidase [Alphaproteobacteria bacterium]|nr:prepilin peptidase [Alphaproteobacteria bacterium]